jgi:DNA-binding FadR family transcriptional regulator
VSEPKREPSELEAAPEPTRGPVGEDEVKHLPSELVFRSIRSRNLFEETVARLSQAIKLGVVPIGGKFPTERELTEQLEVSRVTVREALRALEQAGLVEIRRGRQGGAYVLPSELSESRANARTVLRDMGPELDDAMDYRRAIEPTIVELAADRRDESQLAYAYSLFEQSKQVPPPSFRGADSRLHLALAPMTGAPSLIAAAADVQLRLGELMVAMPILAESIRHSHHQHERILDAIRDRDSQAARDAMIEQVEATAALLHSLRWG